MVQIINGPTIHGFLLFYDVAQIFKKIIVTKQVYI